MPKKPLLARLAYGPVGPAVFGIAISAQFRAAFKARVELDFTSRHAVCTVFVTTNLLQRGMRLNIRKLAAQGRALIAGTGHNTSKVWGILA